MRTSQPSALGQATYHAKVKHLVIVFIDRCISGTAPDIIIRIMMACSPDRVQSTGGGGGGGEDSPPNSLAFLPKIANELLIPEPRVAIRMHK